MRSAALTLALLIILSGAAPATALVPTGVDDGQELAPANALAAAPGLAQIESEDQPTTEIRIQLEGDADARWTVTYRYSLAGEDEVEAFRALGREFENGQADIGFDASIFRSLAAAAGESTGRTMLIRDVEREARVVQSATTTTTTTTTPVETETATGVLELSFTWTGFLEENDDGTLQLGDVFETRDGGTWLSSLGPDQRLTVVTPPGYVISRTSFPIQQQNGSLIIDGPREFTSDERLSVTYRASDQAELPWTLIVGGGIVVVVALALVFVRSRDRPRSRSEESTVSDEAVLTNGGETTATTGKPAGSDGGATTEATSPDGAVSGGAAAHSDDGETDVVDADTEESKPEPDFDLLSDDERVEYLLEQHGGRMKQANIVKETGWSDAKVSQLLSSMAEAGRVEKLRLGRENLISIPDEEEPTEDDDE